MTMTDIGIAFAAGKCVNKYADATSGARTNLTLQEALDIASEDPSLVFVSEES